MGGTSVLRKKGNDFNMKKLLNEKYWQFYL